MSTNYGDVLAFHAKFDLLSYGSPHLLPVDTQNFRVARLYEEIHEFKQAYVSNDLEGAADALVDLVYIAMGTAVQMNLPWKELWDEVQRANMAKVRALRPADSKYGTTLDIVKPKGWQPPRHWHALGLKCPTCQSVGFKPSVLNHQQCEYCDGTFNGEEPVVKTGWDGDSAFALIGDDLQSGEAEFVSMADLKARWPELADTELYAVGQAEARCNLETRLGRKFQTNTHEEL